MSLRKVSACITGVILASLLISSSVMAASTDAYLVREMYGDDVYALQEALTDLGYLDAGVDGYYGSYTEDAVRQYQQDYGLYVDGEAGPQVLTSLFGSNTDSSSSDSSTADVSASESVPSVSSPAVSSSSDGEVLSNGSTGSSVAALQQVLIDLGYLDDGVDGIFGDVTEKALRAYQSAKGLAVDGIAGPVTLSYLLPNKPASTASAPASTAASTPASTPASTTASTPAASSGGPTASLDYASTYLSQGVYGDDVATLQKELIRLGYLNEAADGYYGPYTAEAVRKFQEDKGIYADGEAGSVTLMVLFGYNNISSDSSEAIYKQGDSTSGVQDLQNKLYQLGYLTEKPDGYFGELTTAAVKAFQGNHGINPDGEVSQSLYDQIMSESRPFSSISEDSAYSDIVPLQYALNQHRMVQNISGTFTGETKDAIEEIQERFGLPVTGVADAKTLSYIYNFDNYKENTDDVQGYHSDTEWMIYVNTTTNRAYVYNGSIWNWTEVYNWDCATGAPDTPTTTGEFTANFKGYSFGDESYTCYYFTSFNGPYYMHSTIYNYNSWVDQDNRLNMNLSHGCVRLDTSNAQWIYNNIPLGTKVVVK